MNTNITTGNLLKNNSIFANNLFESISISINNLFENIGIFVNIPIKISDISKFYLSLSKGLEYHLRLLVVLRY